MSVRPDKIWFFNLKRDPLERINIADQLNASTNEGLQRLISNQYGHAEQEEDVSMLVTVFNLLEKVNSEQKEPLWPSLVEVAVLIDKTANSQEMAGDEYVYFAN